MADPAADLLSDLGPSPQSTAPTAAQAPAASGSADDLLSDLNGGAQAPQPNAAPRRVPKVTPDLDAAVRTVIGESSNNADERKAIAAVIRNRARATGASLSDVVHAPGQFEAWKRQGKYLSSLDPTSPVYQQTLATIAPVLSGDEMGDFKADMFYAPKAQAALGRKPPKWDTGHGQDIGASRFFTRGDSSAYGIQPLDLGSTLQQAGENFVPDLKRNAGNVYEAVTHPGQVWQGLQGLGTAVGSKLAGWGGEQQDPRQKATDEAPLNAALNYVRQNYGSGLQPFLHHVAREPVSTGMEVALPFGGAEFGAAKAADALSGVSGLEGAANVARLTSRASGLAAKAVNPVDAAFSLLAPAKYSATTLTGRLTPEASTALSRATEGMMSDADVAALPARQRQALIQTLNSKGVSDAAVKEAVLQAQGLDAPRSILTGEAPQEIARGTVEEARLGNASTLGERAAQMARGNPSDHELASAFAQAQASDFNRIVDGYNDTARMPGSFGAGVNPGDLDNALASAVSRTGVRPTSGPQLSAYLAKADLPQARKAYGLIGDVMSRGKTFFGRPSGVDAPELMQLRRSLTDALYDAHGEDAAVTKQLINGWEQHVHSLDAQGLFKDASGQPVHGVIGNLRQMNADYAQHMDAFRSVPFKKASEALRGDIDPATGYMTPNTDVDAQMAAQGALSNNLFNTTKGADAYNQLSGALQRVPGGQDALDRYIRQSVFQTDATGALAPARGVSEALASPRSAVVKAFASDPEALAQAKLMHSAHRINARPYRRGSRTRASMMGVLGKTARTGMNLGAGFIGAHLAGPLGFVGGQLAEHSAEKIADAIRIAREMRGAPGLGKKTIHLPVRAARAALSAPSTVAAHAFRASHAAGGKVESDDEKIERLTGKLISSAKQAKKAADATTEPLLEQPDERIVRALAVAQRAI